MFLRQSLEELLLHVSDPLSIPVSFITHHKTQLLFYVTIKTTLSSVMELRIFFLKFSCNCISFQMLSVETQNKHRVLFSPRSFELTFIFKKLAPITVHCTCTGSKCQWFSHSECSSKSKPSKQLFGGRLVIKCRCFESCDKLQKNWVAKGNEHCFF